MYVGIEIGGTKLQLGIGAGDGRLQGLWRERVDPAAGPEGIRFLLVSGKPLEEPVAWYGPIVMNTQAQLHQAMSELQQGTFIKHR